MVVFAGQITVEIGESAETKVDIVNIERIMYREVPQPNLRAITVMNAISPVGFHQGHRWVEGEIHVKSEAKAAIHDQVGKDYLPVGAASIACPHFLIKVLTTAGAGWTATILGAKFYSEELVQGEDLEAVTIYKFVATSVALATGA